MMPSEGELERREQVISILLEYGTWTAVAVTGWGLIIGDTAGRTTETTGIALFILLPIARVAAMVALFLRDRDYPYAAIAMLVLTIIAAGIVAGVTIG